MSNEKRNAKGDFKRFQNGSTDESMDKRGRSKNKGRSQRNRGMDHGVKPTFSHNDPDWYRLSPEISSSVARIPFAPAIGQDGVLPTWYGNGAPQLFYGGAIPSCMTFYTYMCPGYSKDLASPVNVAAQKLYTYIRKNQSVYADYEACDLMMYILAMNSAWEYHTWMIKALALANTYSAQNTDIPDTFINAMGINPEDLRRNITDLWGWINIFADRMTSFVTPKDMTFTKRHIYMHGNIFADDPANNYKSQFYHFVPSVFFKYDGYGSENGGRLLPFASPHDKALGTAKATYTVDDIIAIGEEMIQALGDQDIRAMSGDILKAIGEGNIMQLPTVAIDVKVNPVYDANMSLQINNAYIPNTDFGDDMLTSILRDADVEESQYSGWVIHQDGAHGAVIFNPTLSTTIEKFYNGIAKYRINVKADNPSEDDVLEATRFICCLDSTGRLGFCGSDFIVEGRISAGYRGEDFVLQQGPTTLLSTRFVIAEDTGSTNGGPFILSGNVYGLWALSTFKDHPYVDMLTYHPNADEPYRYGGTLGDVDNLTYVDGKVVQRIHYAALMKLFNIPNAMV